jgi:hypothetical protein
MIDFFGRPIKVGDKLLGVNDKFKIRSISLGSISLGAKSPKLKSDTYRIWTVIESRDYKSKEYLILEDDEGSQNDQFVDDSTKYVIVSTEIQMLNKLEE